MTMLAAAWLLFALQTDFGIRTPPGQEPPVRSLFLFGRLCDARRHVPLLGRHPGPACQYRYARDAWLMPSRARLRSRKPLCRQGRAPASHRRADRPLPAGRHEL